MLATIDPSSGFRDPVFDSQAAFRAILDAMAHPGSVREIAVALDPPPPLVPAAACVCLALLDVETPVWLQMRDDGVADFIRFHCGAPVVEAPSRARFALIHDVAAMPVLPAFDAGTDEYPDRSATLIVQVQDLAEGEGISLTGPGIRSRARIAVGAAQEFHDERAAVLGVVDRETRAVAECLQVSAQDLEPERVERADGEALGVVAVQEIGDPGLHLARGLVGEGDRDEVPRRHAVFLDEHGELAGDDGSLAAARAGEDEQRTVDVMNCGFLVRVQVR